MRKSFQDIVDANYENLYRFALSLARSKDDAWDLTQETFLIWARKGKMIRTKASTKSWLYTTLYREFLKTAKRAKRHVEIEEEHFQSEDNSRSIQTLDADSVLEKLLELKIEYRNVISLYYLESYSYKEIARILQIPIGTVMSRLARGKSILRRKITRADEPSNIVGFKQSERRADYG